MMDQTKVGICHLCKVDAMKEGRLPEQSLIRWCGLCKHWFCSACRDRYFSRGLEAVKELLNGSYPNCCGPENA